MKERPQLFNIGIYPVIINNHKIIKIFSTYSSTVSEGMSVGTWVNPRFRQSTTPKIIIMINTKHEISSKMRFFKPKK